VTTGRTGTGPSPAHGPPNRWYRSATKKVTSVVGGLVTVAGILAGVYSDAVRHFINNHVRAAASAAGVLLLIAGAAYVGFRVGGRRIRESLVLIEDHSYEIGPEVAIDIVGHDAVVGRPIRYLERATESPDLLIFLHGLGLDANDFRGYMAETRYHAIAVTMFGFDQRDRHDVRFGVISLESHLALLESFVLSLAKRHPDKRLHLIGFSFGADLLMFLAERQGGRKRRLADSIVLLDPNINRSSMFISTSICQLNLSSPLGGLKKLLEGTSSLIEFQNLCEYLHKVCSKNLAQVQRLACDIRDKWEESGYTQFLNRLAAVDAGSLKVLVAFSFHYEQHFNELIRAAGRINLAVTKMYCTEFDHFQLIGPKALHRQLDAVVETRTP
jgi:pimeloyl-ACP methyl ester carboxylesterase